VNDSFGIAAPSAGTTSIAIDTNVSGLPNQGYRVSIARDSAGNRYILVLVKKSVGTSCATRGTVPSSQINVLHIRNLIGAYQITGVTIACMDNCNNLFTPTSLPTAVFSP
jgi:hypothetical protein